MPGIKVFFSLEADLDGINESLAKKNFKGRIGKDRMLVVNTGTYVDGFGGIQLYYSDPSSRKRVPLRGFFYRYIVWVKNLKGKTLWQNRDYDEYGSPKERTS